MQHKATTASVNREVIDLQQSLLFKAVKEFPSTKNVFDLLNTEI